MPVDRQTISEIGQFDSLGMTQTPGTVVTLATGNTIPSNIGIARVTAAAAVTRIIVTPGVRAGQMVAIYHEGAAANTITMAVAGTSNVADGVSCVITGPSVKFLIWDSVTALWGKIN